MVDWDAGVHGLGRDDSDRVTRHAHASKSAKQINERHFDSRQSGRSQSILGNLSIKRASRVEPTQDGQWTADMGPVGGPMLGPFQRRCDALDAEMQWLENHPTEIPD